MKTTINNQQIYFKGYDARPLKALYLSSPKKELGLELERIGKKAGFDVFIPSGRTLLKASEAKYAYADLSNSPWAQDIATISPKKKIITNEYYDDFEYRSYNTNRTTTIDTGFAVGLGLDFYLTNNVLLFGEANAAYFIEDTGKNSLGGVFRGGLAFQNKEMRRHGMRLNLFIESMITETMSGSSPYFGGGIYF